MEHAGPDLIDPASLAFKSILDRLAPTDATVLIIGETGTGKEVMARYLHHHSPRRRAPFVAVNCGALTESLAESELFGHEKGAFTGATERHRGWFEAAQGGTLLLQILDEAGLTLDDVRIVYAPPKYPLTASDLNAVDAWMMWDPLLSEAERGDQLRVIADGVGRVSNHQFYLADRQFATHSPDLLRLLMTSLEQTGQYIDAHPAEAAGLLAKELGMSDSALRQALARRSHRTQAMNLAIIREQQRIADRFYALGLFPRAINVRDRVWPQ